ncbi:MAG: UDP-2,3-diacylglucosamine diphosphatase LpxI [Gemmataceae bacterium]|nr:UDP-2,3-diacylglucosamine diphosphatase LpxI [Gemmataceae bacterium]
MECEGKRISRRDEPIGLVAGAGRFPVFFAEKARSLGKRIVCVGLMGLADPVLQSLSHRFCWCSVAQVGRTIRFLTSHGVEAFVMAGKVEKKQIIGSPWRLWRLMPDLRTIRMWYRRRRDNRDDSLLLTVIDEMERDGLRCASALDLCPELLASPGILTERHPTASQCADIEFGWDLAKEMGRLDIGQSVMVRERAVLAVEAIEGTDAAIRRAGQLCPRGGFTVVKVAKPQQDRRFDVPTVGPTTIRTMHEAGAAVLAIEAGQTILLDAQETISLANRWGISVVARP